MTISITGVSKSLVIALGAKKSQKINAAFIRIPEYFLESETFLSASNGRFWRAIGFQRKGTS